MSWPESATVGFRSTERIRSFAEASLNHGDLAACPEEEKQLRAMAESADGDLIPFQALREMLRRLRAAQDSTSLMELVSGSSLMLPQAKRVVKVGFAHSFLVEVVFLFSSFSLHFSFFLLYSFFSQMLLRKGH